MKQLFGDLENNDKPLQILKARRCDSIIEFIVEWNPRENGFKPKNSVLKSQELRKYFPIFLLDYYEERIIFGDLSKQGASKNNKYFRHNVESVRSVPGYQMRLEKGANRKLTSLENQMIVEKIQENQRLRGIK